MMEKVMKAFYILMVALIVFLGGLLIAQGAQEPPAQKSETTVQRIIDSQEGSAL